MNILLRNAILLMALSALIASYYISFIIEVTIAKRTVAYYNQWGISSLSGFYSGDKNNFRINNEFETTFTNLDDLIKNWKRVFGEFNVDGFRPDLYFDLRVPNLLILVAMLVINITLPGTGK